MSSSRPTEKTFLVGAAIAASALITAAAAAIGISAAGAGAGSGATTGPSAAVAGQSK